MRASNTNSIVKSTVGLFIVTMLLKVSGYGEKLALAYYFGTDDSADAYILVLSILLAFFFFFREVIEPGVLNVFMRCEEREAWNLFNYLLLIIFFLTGVIALAGVLFPEYFIHVFAPGFDWKKTLLSAQLFRIAAPAIVFLSLSTVTNIVLNAQKKFVFPTAGDVAFKLITIVCIIIFYGQFGIVSAIIGVLVGAAIKLGVHLTLLYRKIKFTSISISKDSKTSMWLLTWPLIIGMIFSQVAGLIDNVFASYMEEGSIAALSYARKIVELPILIFPYVLSVVVFPYFTQLSIEKDTTRSVALLFKSLRWIVIAFIPLVIYFSLFSYEIVAVVFKRGAFDENSTTLTASPLFIYSLGLLFFAIETILVIYYYANSDTKTPIAVGICCVLVNILLTYVLIPFVGYLAIAIALVVQKGLKVILLGGILGKRISLRPDKLLGIVGRLIVPSTVFTLALIILKYLFAVDDSSFAVRITFLGGSLLTGSIIYVLALFVVGLVRVSDFPKLYSRL